MKKKLQTDNAPKAIGPYSQAIKTNEIIFFSGQIPLHPETMEIVAHEFHAQAEQVLKNMKALCEAAGGSLNDIVKLTIYLTDLKNFNALNEIMIHHFIEPFPARTTIEVSALPKASLIEIDAIMSL